MKVADNSNRKMPKGTHQVLEKERKTMGNNPLIVKFCGIRRPEDVEMVNRYQPDMAGFILAPGRKRYVPAEKVRILREKLDPAIQVVGVFVDEDISVVRNLLSSGIIDVAQLHGNEPEDYIRSLQESTGKKVMKAIGIRGDEDIRKAEMSPADLVLLDTPGGGTGSVFDWDLIKQVRRPYLLAGGLHSGNVGEAIEKLHPYGVDVSSGIETDGIKDETKMCAFMAQIRKEI